MSKAMTPVARILWKLLPKVWEYIIPLPPKFLFCPSYPKHLGGGRGKQDARIVPALSANCPHKRGLGGRHGSPRAGRSCRCIRQAGSKGISCFLCSLGGREEWWLHRNQPPSEHSREGHGGSNLLPQHQESGWRSSGSRQYHQQRDPVSRPQPPDCRHSLHGCCPDGHTVAPGPLGRGCPRISCQQSTIVLDRTEYSGVQVTLGQMVRFFCVAGASPDVKWQKNGKPVRSSNRYHLQLDGSLAISSVSEEDAGTYTCSTSVGGQDSSRQVQLWITGDDREAPAEAERNLPPIQDHKHLDFGMGGGRPGHRPSSPRHRQPGPRLSFDRNQPGVVDANIGQRVQLPCRTSGYPPPVIEWQKDGQPLSSPRHQQQPDGSLLISRVSREDGGFYTCIAFNQREREQRWVQLRILGELKIVGLEPAVTVPEGGDTELHCVVLGDDVNVRWSRNGVPLRGDGYRIHLSQDGTLVINNTRARDEGSYTCSAYSGSQAVSRSTEVKVVYPRPPEAVEQPRDPSRECIDQPELANCDLILQAQLCGNEYYSSFCCASCSRYQPQARPVWQQG
uniref:Papilin, proteoglycan like sulfated glycoprotein n=1 Tax=Monodelphis domestica TaxID=13616 RepID=A0A5F8HLR9_MONDO